METNYNILDKGVAIKSTKVSSVPGRMISDSGIYVAKGGSVFYSDPLYELPLRDLGPDNMNNKYEIGLSIISSPPPGHGGIDRIKYNYVTTVVDGHKVYRTANNVVPFSMEDMANLPQWEESDRYIESWRATTELNRAISYGELAEFEGLTVSRTQRLVDAQLNKWVNDIVFEGHYNDFGKYLSKAETLRQDWKNYLLSEEGMELALEKLGDGEDIAYIGVTPSEGTIYSIGRLQNGGVRLSIGTKAYEYLSKEADFYGISLEDMITVSLGEEAMHHYRKSYDKWLFFDSQRIGEELATKRELLDFYRSKLSGSEPNQKLRSKYAKIVEDLEEDIATTKKRYMEHYKSRGKENNRTEKLRAAYEAEAIAKGLNEEETAEYVANRLEESGEDLENRSKDGTEGLEEIVDGEVDESRENENVVYMFNNKGDYDNASDETAEDVDTEKAPDADYAKGERNDVSESDEVPVDEAA